MLGNYSLENELLDGYDKTYSVTQVINHQRITVTLQQIDRLYAILIEEIWLAFRGIRVCLLSRSHALLGKEESRSIRLG